MIHTIQICIRCAFGQLNKKNPYGFFELSFNNKQVNNETISAKKNSRLRNNTEECVITKTQKKIAFSLIENSQNFNNN